MRNNDTNTFAICDMLKTKKSKKLCDTITKINLPKFDDKDKKQKSLKPTIKKLGDAQKNKDVAKARVISTKEIMCFDDLINNKLLTVKPGKKSDLVKKLEKRLTSSDYNFTSESQLRMAVVVDFMSLIRRYPTSKLKTFNDLFSIATYAILHATCVEETVVYDSY